MTTEGPPQTEARPLEIALDADNLRVSSLSSMLRVVQAAIREVARSDDSTRQSFSQRPQPTLHLSANVTDGALVLRLIFTDPSNSMPMLLLSERTFGRFLDELGQFIKLLPQKGLWGESVGGAQRRRYDSDVDRRLDQVRLELRRFPKARLTFDRSTISFEGDRMEIG